MEESNHFGLIDQHQLGSRDYHCAVDAGLCVVHNIEACHQARHAVALLLFDISGFFNNIHTAVPSTSFLSWGSLQKSSSGPRPSSPPGTHASPSTMRHLPLPWSSWHPQGSPCPHPLSHLHLSHACHLNSVWMDKTVQLYVNDGAIFASGVTALVLHLVSHPALRRSLTGLATKASGWTPTKRKPWCSSHPTPTSPSWGPPPPTLHIATCLPGLSTSRSPNAC
jgi:hypothetical protein